MASCTIESLRRISLFSFCYLHGMYFYLHLLFGTYAPTHFPKSVNISMFRVNCSMTLEPMPAQPLSLRSNDRSFSALQYVREKGRE